jgi:CPA2 family monovalent cation:H+ antiporter-2
MHELPLITTIAAAFTGAWLFGLLTQRLGLSPIVGYLLAGVLIGPHTPGFVGDIHLAQQLAEVGVILLMFGVGLNFHVRELLAVRSIAVPGAVVQSLTATVLAIVVFGWFGLPAKTGMVIGMALAVASTVVLIRVVMDANALNSPAGHVAVGWLVVEDIFTVILLVLIPILGFDPGSGHTNAATPEASVWRTVGITILKLAALVAIVLLAVSRVVPRIMAHVARLRSRELFTLTILVFSIAIAVAAYEFFGASVALGAFLAGLVLAQSPVSHQAAAEILPLRDAFAVLFFVSVGMLLDPTIVVRQPLMTLAAMGIILIAKPLSALAIVALLGHPARTALTVAIGLGQIGEFSFILSDLAQRYGLMTEDGHNVLIASAILSITLNPIAFRSIPRLEGWMKRRRWLWTLLNGRAERRAAARAVMGGSSAADAPGQVAIVAGFGPVGRSAHRLLKDAGMQTVVIDLSLDTVLALQREGQAAIYGDAALDSVLEKAGVHDASHFLLALPHTADRVGIVATVRSMNPEARILVRARYLRERDMLERAGATAAVFEEAEAAVALARLVLADTGVHRQAAERKIGDLRLQLILDNVSNIRTQRVRSVMVPWTRVRSVLSGADREAVLRQVSQERFSRWPVVEPRTGRPVGYLLTKDLIAHTLSSDWMDLVRPLPTVSPEDSIEAALAKMQSENATIYLVQDGDSFVGLITLEDILEQVVGRIEDEYPHEPEVSLRRAIERGGMVLDLTARSHDGAIQELVEAIPGGRLPPGMDNLALTSLVLEREAEFSTYLGSGVAAPHARCPGLGAPLVVFGRSEDGIPYSPQAPERVHLLFLLLTSAEQPELQLTLLSQLANLVCEESSRDALRRATSPAHVLEIIPDRLK